MNENYENYKISLIAALRVWRNKDHEDNIVLSRNDVINLLAEIDDRKNPVRYF